MARPVSSSGSKRKSRPALSPEAREQQLINKAYAAAERQLDEGTASSQVITHFLLFFTARAELEKEKIRVEIEEKKAKVKAIENGEEMKVLYENAIKAMRDYGGYGSGEDYEDEDDWR